MPPSLHQLTDKPRGIVLVTGPTGSGKSTTLAALIDEINRTRHEHILTIEDPIEFVHKHKSCIVNQREVGVDAVSFAEALRAALREDPDVILLGEMRDLETIGTALTAAETGHLVFGTLHTQSASSTVDRLIDVFPAEQQEQIRIQIANSLQGILTQALLPTADGQGRVAALEILYPDDAVRNLIRQGKVEQIYSIMQTGTQRGMQTMEQSLAELVQRNVVTSRSRARARAAPDQLLGLLERAGYEIPDDAEEDGRAASSSAACGSREASRGRLEEGHLVRPQAQARGRPRARAQRRGAGAARRRRPRSGRRRSRLGRKPKQPEAADAAEAGQGARGGGECAVLEEGALGRPQAEGAGGDSGRACRARRGEDARSGRRRSRSAGRQSPTPTSQPALDEPLPLTAPVPTGEGPDPAATERLLRSALATLAAQVRRRPGSLLPPRCRPPSRPRLRLPSEPPLAVGARGRAPRPSPSRPAPPQTAEPEPEPEPEPRARAGAGLSCRPPPRRLPSPSRRLSCRPPPRRLPSPGRGAEHPRSLSRSARPCTPSRGSTRSSTRARPRMTRPPRRRRLRAGRARAAACRRSRLRLSRAACRRRVGPRRPRPVVPLAVPVAAVPRPQVVHPPVPAAELPPVPDEPKVPFWKKEIGGSKKPRRRRSRQGRRRRRRPIVWKREIGGSKKKPKEPKQAKEPKAEGASTPFWKKELGGSRKSKKTAGAAVATAAVALAADSETVKAKTPFWKLELGGSKKKKKQEARTPRRPSRPRPAPRSR